MDNKKIKYCRKTYRESDYVNKCKELDLVYLGNEKPIKCRCKKCLYEWETLPKVLVTNGSGCPECGKIKRTMSRTKTQSQFVDELKQVNPDIEVIGHYVNTHTKIECKCRVCNTVWYGYPANLLNKSASCLVCNISIGEKSLLD